MRTFFLVATFALHIFAAPTQHPLFSSSFGIAGTNASFDYVIVGGGTAGLAMALRLSADGSNSVAVIEAGGFYEIGNGNISVIPAEGTFFAGSDPSNTQPLVDWGFVTSPQAVGRSNSTLSFLNSS